MLENVFQKVPSPKSHTGMLFCFVLFVRPLCYTLDVFLIIEQVGSCVFVLNTTSQLLSM